MQVHVLYLDIWTQVVESSRTVLCLDMRFDMCWCMVWKMTCMPEHNTTKVVYKVLHICQAADYFTTIHLSGVLRWYAILLAGEGTAGMHLLSQDQDNALLYTPHCQDTNTPGHQHQPQFCKICGKSCTEDTGVGLNWGIYQQSLIMPNHLGSCYLSSVVRNDIISLRNAKICVTVVLWGWPPVLA